MTQAAHLRKNLTNLDTYMATVNSNIKLFNGYVKENVEGLKARGESTDDLMTNLFKGYLVASDVEFVWYIKAKKDAYEDGEDVSKDKLMTPALNKYKILTSTDQWNAVSAKQEQIIALTSTVEKLKDDNLKLAKSIKSKGKSNTNNKQKQGQNQNQNANPTHRNQPGKRRQLRPQDAWKLVAPKDSEPKHKVHDGKEYWWCTEHPM